MYWERRVMSCCCNNYGKTIQYVSPAHGGWGMVRIGALVPESHQLFVAPFACGRHGALGGEVNGIKDRISYLYIDESDIVSGNYEHLIPDAVEELFETLEKRPKVLLIFVTCLDDLLGTDHEALNQRLSAQFPDVEFRSCHMNPISHDTKFPPGITLQNTLYSLLPKAEEKENTINMIGNNVAGNEACELFQLLKDHGYSVNHMSNFDTFEGFQTMSKSKVNLVLSPVAKYASSTMKTNLEIEPLYAYHTYDMAEIESFYKELATLLNVPMDYSQYKEEAKAMVLKALSIIGQHPIAIDYQAVRKPFTLAKALLEYGFNVKFVMTDDVKSIEKDAYEYITQNFKDIQVINAIHHDMVKRENENLDYLCIGFDCAYATDAKRVVDLKEDESLFGFYGIKELMSMMVKAYTNPVNLHDIIEEAGLIV